MVTKEEKLEAKFENLSFDERLNREEKGMIFHIKCLKRISISDEAYKMHCDLIIAHLTMHNDIAREDPDCILNKEVQKNDLSCM